MNCGDLAFPPWQPWSDAGATAPVEMPRLWRLFVITVVNVMSGHSEQLDRRKRMTDVEGVEKRSRRSKDRFAPLDHPGHLVRRLHQICVSVFLDKSREYGLTHTQYAALLAVQFAPGIDQDRLGKLIAIDRQTTSNVVSRLSEKSLLEKKQKDKRTNALFLTGAAKALIRVMQQHEAEIDETILKPLTAKERLAFMRLLTKLVSANNDLSRAPQSAP